MRRYLSHLRQRVAALIATTPADAYDQRADTERQAAPAFRELVRQRLERQPHPRTHLTYSVDIVGCRVVGTNDGDGRYDAIATVRVQYLYNLRGADFLDDEDLSTDAALAVAASVMGLVHDDLEYTVEPVELLLPVDDEQKLERRLIEQRYEVRFTIPLIPGV